MYSQIYGNITRQTRGLQLLGSLLEEEFTYLTERNVDEVASIEFSIHELIRQLTYERQEIVRTLQGVRLREYAQMLPPEEKDCLMNLAKELEDAEQACAKQSTRNSELSLALLDQGQALLDFLYTSAVPDRSETYNPKGSMYKQHPQAAVLSGRC